MTRIDFYVNVEERTRTACHLAARALEQQARLFVLTRDEAHTAQVDRMMWCQPQLSFVPHVQASHALAARTPVIVDHRHDPLPHDDVLVNLTDEPPPWFSRFSRLIEIVSTDDADRARARSRWRFYRERGYELNTVDVAATADAARSRPSRTARA